MARNITFNGVVYTVPDVGDDSWGLNLTNYFVAIPQGALQKSGGTFTLSADVDFGGTYGLLSSYFKTRGVLPATSGLVRLNLTDTIAWRNNANNANLALAINGSDQLTFNGTPIYTNGVTSLTGDVTGTGPGATATTIAANIVSNAKLRQSAGLSIIGNPTNATANVADITASVTGAVLGNTGSALTFALLMNSNIDPAAAIAYSKLSLASSIVNADINASAAIAYSKLNLTGNILNADISGSAAIAFSKLATLSSGNILVGNGSNVAASVAMSGDITLSNAGVTAIGANKVTNSQLAQMAASTVKANITVSTANASDVSVVSTSTASSLMLRDANANTSVNNITESYSTTTTAAGITTLTVSSAFQQYFTGTTTQTVKLPDSTTLPSIGFSLRIVNLSTGALTLQDAGANTLSTIAASSLAMVTAKSVSTANGSWDVQTSVNNAGGGTVTSVGLSMPTEFSVASSPVTTSGTIAVTKSNQTAGTFFCGPQSGSAAAPTFKALQPPTVQTFLSGSGTYTLPAGALYLKLRMIGGGSGGGGSGTGSSGGTGGLGGDTTWKTTGDVNIITAGGGVATGTSGGSSGNGGSNTVAAGPITIKNQSGTKGAGAFGAVAGGSTDGGRGGDGPFGGSGTSVGAAVANSGAGGGGGYFAGAGNAGPGGGSGGYYEGLITSPTSSYHYAVGAAGSAGTAGTSGIVGTAGGSGYIEVTEYYQ